MPDFIAKKLEQAVELIKELEKCVLVPFSEFKNNLTYIRASERNFLLLVELASDINAHLLLEADKKTPDSYQQSFSEAEKAGIIPEAILEPLKKSARLRNILVHEYDFDEDNFIFYESVKSLLPAYREYISVIHNKTKK